MVEGLYRQVMRFGTPVINYWLQKRHARGKEDITRLSERRGQAACSRPAGKLIWCHAASVGESLSFLVLVNRLLERYPDAHLMMTTGTVTSAKLMADRLPGRAFHQYMPVDHPRWVAQFLDHWQPDMVIWAESEYWPNMIAEIRKRHIPAALVNARMSPKSFIRWQRVPSFIGRLLSAFDVCLAQNAAEGDRLEKLGAKKVCVSGNLKYAARPLPYNEKDCDALLAAIGTRPVWTFASTHPGEEEMAITVHQHLKQTLPDMLSLVIPRHPQRGAEIATQLRAAGLKVCVRSEGKLPDDTDDIYLCDTIGEMGLFFSAVKPVAMGGSFVPHGGHNPIEPAQYGCVVLYGPHMFNFLSICEDFEKVGAAWRVQDAQDLAEKLQALLQDPQQGAGVSKAAQKLTQDMASVVETIMQDLSPVLTRFDDTASDNKKGAAA